MVPRVVSWAPQRDLQSPTGLTCPLRLLSLLCLTSSRPYLCFRVTSHMNHLHSNPRLGGGGLLGTPKQFSHNTGCIIPDTIALAPLGFTHVRITLYPRHVSRKLERQLHKWRGGRSRAEGLRGHWWKKVGTRPPESKAPSSPAERFLSLVLRQIKQDFRNTISARDHGAMNNS